MLSFMIASMPFVDKFFPQIREFAGHYSPRVLIDLFLLVLFVAFVLRFNTAGKLQRLWDPIPCVFNTLQFLLDNERFMIRVKWVFSIEVVVALTAMVLTRSDPIIGKHSRMPTLLNFISVRRPCTWCLAHGIYKPSFGDRGKSAMSR